jgi:hypothetical protein
MSWKSESLNLLEPSGPHRGCYGTALSFNAIDFSPDDDSPYSSTDKTNKNNTYINETIQNTVNTGTRLTFKGPCIVIYSYNKSQQDALFLKFIFDKELFMFRTYLLSIIRSLNTVFRVIVICHVSYVDCRLGVPS